MNSTQLPWPIFPEELVLGDLLKHSEAFRAFYQEKRDKITQEVNWAQDPRMPEGITARSTRIVSQPDGQSIQIVRLRQVPALVDDAFRVAHELEHFVLNAEGFPVTGCCDFAYENLSSALNSMLHDPLVDSRLQKYKFDLKAHHEAEVAEHIRQLEGLTRSPARRLDRTRWVFYYVENALYWELLIADGERNKFQEWLDARYPDIASIGQKLLTRIKRIGFDTPEKQTQLFQEIVRRYKLDNFVFI